MPRTGSSHLVSILNGHPDITCHGEVFHKKKIFLRGRARLDDETLTNLESLRNSNRLGFLEAVYGLDYGKAHCGFKIFRNHDPEALSHLIANSSVAKIVLCRENVLANFASTRAARTTGDYALANRSAPEKTPLVHFDGKVFAKFRDRYVEFYRTVLDSLRSAGQDFLALRYAEINHLEAWERLQTFLGATVHAPKSAQDEGRRRNVLARFSNGEDAREFLAANGLSDWAQEEERVSGPLSSEPLLQRFLREETAPARRLAGRQTA